MLSAFAVALAALAADWLLGEPRRQHPLVGFGALAARIEGRLRPARPVATTTGRLLGCIALAATVAPPVLLAGWLAGWLGPVFEVLCLYLALGHRSLHQHARPVADALVAGDEAAARTLASRLVSRDAHTMHVARATTESVLENGCDAVLASLFWYLAAGAPGVVAHRLCNTLDAMWGYRNQRYRDFGWAAARSDDVLNWCPARLCALGYALLGRTGAALDCVRRQAARWESPNAGVVMAAGAGALQVTLGGPARYRGEVRERVRLGAGAEPGPEDILRALSLLRASVALWLVVSGLAAFAPLVPQVPAG